jgi:hypothetical protein
MPLQNHSIGEKTFNDKQKSTLNDFIKEIESRNFIPGQIKP